MPVPPLPDLERLQLVIARLQRLQFGRKSENIGRQIEEFELQLKDLEARTAEERQQTEQTLPPAAAAAFAIATRKPGRRPLPEHVPREVAMAPAILERVCLNVKL